MSVLPSPPPEYRERGPEGGCAASMCWWIGGPTEQVPWAFGRERSRGSTTGGRGCVRGGGVFKDCGETAGEVEGDWAEEAEGEVEEGPVEGDAGEGAGDEGEGDDGGAGEEAEVEDPLVADGVPVGA